MEPMSIRRETRTAAVRADWDDICLLTRGRAKPAVASLGEPEISLHFGVALGKTEILALYLTISGR